VWNVARIVEPGSTGHSFVDSIPALPLIGHARQRARNLPSSTSLVCRRSIRWLPSISSRLFLLPASWASECIISGIRPQIAQTIVHLGLDLNVVSTATMADAFQVALRRVGKVAVDRA
jgi:hypothetical protein